MQNIYRNRGANFDLRTDPNVTNRVKLPADALGRRDNRKGVGTLGLKPVDEVNIYGAADTDRPNVVELCVAGDWLHSRNLDRQHAR